MTTNRTPTAALAFAAYGETNFARTLQARNDIARRRIGRDLFFQGFHLLFAHAQLADVFAEGFGAKDLHGRNIRQQRISVKKSYAAGVYIRVLHHRYTFRTHENIESPWRNINPSVFYVDLTLCHVVYARTFQP